MKNILSIKFVTGALCAAGMAAALIVSPLTMQSASAQAPAAVQSAAPAAADAKPAAKAKKPPTAGQLAARERAKKCGAEWKAAKAAGKIEKGQKWPQYWSACNKRLKA